MSDDISQYNEEQLAVFKDVLRDDDCRLVNVIEENGKVFIDYVQNGKPGVLAFDSATGAIY